MIFIIYLSVIQITPVCYQTGVEKSAVFIPMGFDLSCQRDDAVVLTLIFHNAGQGCFNIGIFDQQTHAAAQFALNGPWCRSNAVFHIGFQKQIP